jgi:hypothetical protein
MLDASFLNIRRALYPLKTLDPWKILDWSCLKMAAARIHTRLNTRFFTVAGSGFPKELALLAKYPLSRRVFAGMPGS